MSRQSPSHHHHHPSSSPNSPLPQTIAESTSGRLDSAAEWLDGARRLLSESRATLIALQLQSERLLASQTAVTIRIDEMAESLDEVGLLVRQALQHAEDLTLQVGGGTGEVTVGFATGG